MDTNATPDKENLEPSAALDDFDGMVLGYFTDDFGKFLR